MAMRYSTEALLHLRDSPLCTRPNGLPPPEEWMGPLADNNRNSYGNGKPGEGKNRNSDNPLTDHTSKRPGGERGGSRTVGNPEEIILGPPRTTFNSATVGARNGGLRDSEARDRFATLRNRGGDGEARERGDRDRDRERDKDGRTGLRRRAEADPDSDGWVPVKPRKSFGHDGAERFNRSDKFGGSDRRVRDTQQDDRDREGERPLRRNNFGEFGRDKDADDGERPRRNGFPRTRAEGDPWSRGTGTNNNADGDAPPPAQKSFDRVKSWRDRDTQQADSHGDKPRERNYERRWEDREHRPEREPEWLDEPAEEKAQGHTTEDMQKFLESMRATKTGAKADAAPLLTIDTSTRNNVFDGDKIKTAPPIDLGPDKFFANFAPASAGPIETAQTTESAKEPATASRAKGSRFQNFFAAAQEDRRQPEPAATPTDLPNMPPPDVNPLLAMANARMPTGTIAPVLGPIAGEAPDTDRVAFQGLLQKLRKQHLDSNTPPSTGSYPPPGLVDSGPKSAVASPGPPGFPMFGAERRDEPLIHHGQGRGAAAPQPQVHEGHASRPQSQQPPQMFPGPSRGQSQGQVARPEHQAQILNDLIGQRQHQQAQMSGQPPTAARLEHSRSRTSNSNAEFLMTLMQRARNVPEPLRGEAPLRMPQPSRPAQIPQTPDRELEFQRERSASHLSGHQGHQGHLGRPQGPPQGPPGFFDDAVLHHHEQEGRRQQPTQILQRQGPPSLDHQLHGSAAWMQQGGPQLPSGSGRPPMIPPPPGLVGGPNPRNGPGPGPGPGPMPPVFPPNFPMGGFPPPESMPGPHRNMGPPPGFFAPPPPGFPGMGPPPPMVGGFQGGPPEALAYGFDGRMPPPGSGGLFRRN